MEPLLALAAALSAASFTPAELRATYYSDLGPAEVDVSSYPKEQQANYEVFRLVCSRCHTPARALHSPVATREGWRGYVSEMRLRGKVKGFSDVTPEQAEAVVSFLAYDGKVRKLDGRAGFDEQTRRLQKRFWETIEERMRRLQRSPRPR